MAVWNADSTGVSKLFVFNAHLFFLLGDQLFSSLFFNLEVELFFSLMGNDYKNEKKLKN